LQFIIIIIIIIINNNNTLTRLLVLCKVHDFTPWLSWQALLRGCVLCEVRAEAEEHRLCSLWGTSWRKHHPYSTTWHNHWWN